LQGAKGAKAKTAVKPIKIAKKDEEIKVGIYTSCIEFRSYV